MMRPMNLESMKTAYHQLPPQDREAFLEYLYGQEDAACLPADHKAELECRIASLNAGKMEFISLDSVMDELRAENDTRH